MSPHYGSETTAFPASLVSPGRPLVASGRGTVEQYVLEKYIITTLDPQTVLLVPCTRVSSELPPRSLPLLHSLAPGWSFVDGVVP